MDEPVFNKAIPGTEALGGALRFPVIAKKSFDANTAIAKRSYSQHASITAGLAIA